MLKIGWISYAFVEFPFVLENVYHVFRKFEEKTGEYKELSIVSVDEKQKSEKNLIALFK